MKQENSVDGIVHHYANVHYIITNQEQLNTVLKQFKDGEKVRIIILKK